MIKPTNKTLLAAALVAVGMMITGNSARAFLYRATDVGDMWDPYVIYQDGQYYMFYMVGKNPDGWGHRAMCLATSKDAVHWDEKGPIADGREGPVPVFAGRVWRVGDRFVMNHGSVLEVDGKRSQCIRFWDSRDLVHWKDRGEQGAVLPDPRWYGSRWDCMDAIPKNEDDPSGGWWGYLTGDTREDRPHMSVGMLESDDGVDWRAIEPPVFDWDGLPQQLMEVGGCQRIGGKYFMILGARKNYLGNRGYSMCTFVADDPKGPFRPDVTALRLYGASHRDATWLASFCRSPDGVLVCNYMARTIPGPEVYFTPLKRAIVDKEGHLRLGYWEANDAVKGEPVALDPARSKQIHAAGEEGVFRCEGSPEGLRLTAKWKRFRRELGGPSAIALLENRFDLDQGVVLEGTIRITDTAADTVIKTHIPPAIGGFYIEEKSGAGTGILFETYGITRIAGLTLGDGSLEADTLDVTGPGCATVAGAHCGREHSFRLFIRMDMIEAYLDDLLVQTFHIPKANTGRLGFFVQSGTVEWKDLKAWSMSLRKEELAK